MKPIDCRNETWKDVMLRMSKMRLRVYEIVSQFGPGTTEQLAMASGMSILSLRPRVTELHDMGMVDMVGKADGGKDSIFKAVPLAEAERRYVELQKTGAVQMPLC